MKLYAKQIPPEYQESPLFLDDFGFQDIEVFGNPDFNEHCSDFFNGVWKAVHDGELLEVWEDLNDGGRGWYHNWSEALADLLPPEGREAYSRHERKNVIPQLLEKYSRCNCSEEYSIMCEILDVVTGKPWDYRTIRGTCQSDWQYIMYPVENWSREALEAFETEYFNTGSGWIIHDDDTEPEGAEDIDGYSCYCHGWNDDQIREEIRSIADASPETEIVLYKFEGYSRIGNWSIA